MMDETTSDIEAIDKECTDSEPSVATDTEQQADDDLRSENRELRERVDQLEAALADVQAKLDAGADSAETGEQQRSGAGIESPEDTTESEAMPELVTSGGQPTKVVGRLDDDDGIGVFGEATGDGVPIGVRGEVPENSFGYGLYTGEDAYIGDDLEVGEDLEVGDDLRLNTENTPVGVIRFEGSSTSPPRISCYTDPERFNVKNASRTDIEMNLRVNDETDQRTAGPYAKATIDQAGFVSSGVNIDSAAWNSNKGAYEVEIADVSDYSFEDYCVNVTPHASSTGEVITNTITDDNDKETLIVQFGDTDFHDFHIVVWELPDGTVTTSEMDHSADEEREAESERDDE